MYRKLFRKWMLFFPGSMFIGCSVALIGGKYLGHEIALNELPALLFGSFLGATLACLLDLILTIITEYFLRETLLILTVHEAKQNLSDSNTSDIDPIEIIKG